MPTSGTIKISQPTYTEYHICGDLSLSGTGVLAGTSASADTVIIVENGKISISNNAKVSTMRTTLVLTGVSTYASYLDFPNGNGQSATLSLSPSTSADNPWHGVALFQNPLLTTSVNNDWGPGATFTADGLVYLPHSVVQLRGVANSGNYRCSKFAVYQFQTNGSAALSFAQTDDGCAAIRLNQWGQLHLTQ
jgi:hypothetical protein